MFLKKAGRGLIFLTILSLTFFYHVNSAGIKEKRARIVGGSVAATGQFPFAAVIHQQTEKGRFLCGGTLLSNQWVITAGHCVANAVSFTIFLGSNTMQGSDTNRITVVTNDYILHENYNPATFENDIGLIKLRLPLVLNDYIQPVFLPTVDLSAYLSLTIIGWGQTSDVSAGNNQLYYATVTALKNEECQKYFSYRIGEGMICVGGNYNEGACNGDSGSPLILSIGEHDWIVGVSSFISGKGCETTDPSGYTRSFYYLNWIHARTGLNGSTFI